MMGNRLYRIKKPGKLSGLYAGLAHQPYNLSVFQIHLLLFKLRQKGLEFRDFDLGFVDIVCNLIYLWVYKDTSLV